jgi:hypothetical protein
MKTLHIKKIKKNKTVKNKFIEHNWIRNQNNIIVGDIQKCCPLIQSSTMLTSQLPTKLQLLDIGVYPNNQNYNNERLNYNKLFNYFPLAIFYPTNTSDVSYLIKHIYNSKIAFSIRCGGHSFESASLNSGIIIDVSKMNEYIKFNNDKTNITISPNFRLGKVANEIAKHKLIMATGTCACVGICGISLGGGVGALSRMFGVMADNIVSIKMINYKGEIITASPKSNPDLLWALKGAGTNNFGVITEITMKVYKDLYFYQTKYVWSWNKKQAFTILKTYQDWFITLPNNIYTLLTISYLNGDVNITLTISKYGNDPITEDEMFIKLFNPKITKLDGFYSSNLNDFIGGCGDNFYPFLKVKSFMVFKPLKDSGLSIIVDSFETQIANNYKMSFELNFQQLGGQVNNGDSCYFPKKAITVLYYELDWSDVENSDNILNFGKKLYSDLVPYTSTHCLPSALDFDVKDYMSSYYGNNKDKLIKIKRKYDPNNFFQFKQSIREL